MPPGPPGAPGDGKNIFSQPKAPDSDEEKGPRSYIHKPRHASAWMLFLGAIVMLVSLGTPWWSWTLTSTTQSATYYVYVWGVTCSGPNCPGASSSPIQTPTLPTLISGGFPPNMGSLYGGVLALCVLAGILGLAAAAVLFYVSRGLSEYPKAVDRATLLGYLALSLSLLTPVMLSIAQPYSLRGDFSFPLQMAQSPGTDFSGTLQGGTWFDHTYTSMSWGPTYSWYLCVLAAALFFGGTIMPHLTRHEPVARRDLIRHGLLKLQAPIRRPLPAAIPGRPVPMAYPAGGGPYALPPGRPAPMYAGYGPQYTSLAPGVGWARPLPAPGTPYRPTPALPPGSRPTPGPYAAASPQGPYRPAPAPYRPVPSPSTPPPFRPAGTPAPAGGMPSPRPGPAPMAARPVGAQPMAARPAPATAAPPTARPAPPAVRTAGNRNCPNCQTYVAPPALRCTKCGTLLPRS